MPPRPALVPRYRPTPAAGRVLIGRVPRAAPPPVPVGPNSRTLRALAQQRTILPLRAGASVSKTLRGAWPMSVTSSLTFFRGEDITLDFTMTPPADITGWTLSLEVASALGGTVQFTKAASIIDGPRGRFRVTIASADTASLAVGRYVWDCRRTDAGNKATVADGSIDLRQEVTP